MKTFHHNPSALSAKKPSALSAQSPQSEPASAFYSPEALPRGPNACPCDGNCPACSSQSSEATEIPPVFEGTPGIRHFGAPAENSNPRHLLTLRMPSVPEVEHVSPNRLADIAQTGVEGPQSTMPYQARQESKFGTDFSHVRVHTDDKAKDAARLLGANAYTWNQEIAFAQSKPDETTLSHELTHVLQQQSGETGAPSLAKPDGAAEQEAHQLAASHQVDSIQNGLALHTLACDVTVNVDGVVCRLYYDPDRECIEQRPVSGLAPGQVPFTLTDEQLNWVFRFYPEGQAPDFYPASDPRNQYVRYCFNHLSLEQRCRIHYVLSNHPTLDSILRLIREGETAVSGFPQGQCTPEMVGELPSQPTVTEATPSPPEAPEASPITPHESETVEVAPPTPAPAPELDIEPEAAGTDWERDEAGNLTPAALQQIRGELIALGVQAGEGDRDRIGDLNQLNGAEGMTNGQINQAFLLLRELAQGGSRRGAPNRVIRAWNAGLDDLGPNGIVEGGRYFTILHYMRELERLAPAAGRTDESAYLFAIQHMPNVVLAGAEVPVNERATYFVAAAQYEMDTQAGMTGGRHYIAAASLERRVRSLWREVRGISRLNRRHRPGETLPSDLPDRYNRIIPLLNQMLELMMQQQAQEADTPGSETSDYAEPAMRDWFIGNAARIRALRRASTPEEALAAAVTLEPWLGTSPGGDEMRHGYGSLDPHGTDHAIGLAIDLFNGRGSSSQNFGVTETFWPFIYYVMDNYPIMDGQPPEMRGMRPTAIHQLAPQTARNLSVLLQTRCLQAAREIEARWARAQAEASTAAPPTPAEAREQERARAQQARADQRLIAQARSVFQSSINRVNALRQARYRDLHRSREFQEQATALLTRLQQNRDQASTYSPEQLQQELHARAWELRLLSIIGERLLESRPMNTTTLVMREARAREALATPRGEPMPEPPSTVAPRRTPRATWQRELQEVEQALERLTEQIDLVRHVAPDYSSGRAPSLSSYTVDVSTAIAGGAQARWELRQLEDLHDLVVRRDFQTWLSQVSVRGIYTQSPIVIESINRVRAHPNQETMVEGEEYRQTHFYGGHHWQVAPREILRRRGTPAATSDAAYFQALRRDMSHRTSDQLTAIVRIMAEWPDARPVLQQDAVFHRALGVSLTSSTDPAEQTAAGLSLCQSILSETTP